MGSISKGKIKGAPTNAQERGTCTHAVFAFLGCCQTPRAAMPLPLDGCWIRRGALDPSTARNPRHSNPFATSSLRDGNMIEAPP
ncbi:MAG: hypothetical protein RLZZ117_1053 [Cyanobacteriota bacterium]